MKKKLAVLALCLLLVSGCGKKIPTLKNGEEAVITLKSGTKISANELYNELKDDYALNALIDMVDKKILEKDYKKQIKAANKEADSVMKELEEAYGDDLESTIQYYTKYSTKEAYREYVYLDYLKGLAIDDYCKEQITDKEIKEYYDDEIVADIKVDHILITAKVKDDMTDEEKKAEEDKAKKTVDTIIKELKKTNSKKVLDKFKELVEEYSEDEATKKNSGSLGYINKDTLDSTYDELVKAAYKLKDGEYSTKVITTELGYHVILRESSKEKAALKDVKDSIVEKLAETYKSEHSVATVKAMQELRKKHEMEIVDSELKAQYAKKIQSDLSSALAQDQQQTTEQQTTESTEK